MSVSLDRLLSHHRGELSDAEAEALRQRLASDPALRADAARVASMADGLAETAAPSFGPYFSDRVMARLRTPPEADPVVAFGDALRRLFVRVALASAVVVAGFAIAAERDDDFYGGSFVEAALGLPPAAAETFIAFEAETLVPLQAQ
ncbi:MAG: hypothetical protein AAF791_02115 [Bacteroidota bacterium]